MSESADLQLTTDRSYSEERRRRPLGMDSESEGGGAASVLGYYPAGGFHIIVVGEVLLFCTFLHFKISSSNYCHVLPHLTVPLSSFAKNAYFVDILFLD